MKKIYRLTESDLNCMIMNAVQDILMERHVLKVPNQGNDMPMDMPPMDDPNAMGGDDEISNMINQLSQDDKDAAKKYIQSMIDKNNADGNADNGGDMSPMDDANAQGGMPPMNDPNAMGGQQPMQENFMFQDSPRKREFKEINPQIKNKGFNPFIINR